MELSNENIILVSAICGVLTAATVGVFTIAQTIGSLLQWIITRGDSERLKQNLSRGPYDSATIDLSTKHYVRPKCSNLDPAQEVEPRHALIATREDLFIVVDRFLDEATGPRHLLVLADSGMGKTAFVLNYYAHNLRRKGKRRHHIMLVPLGMKDADSAIKSMEDKNNTVVFLDAFDEDVEAIDDHRDRIRILMELCAEFRRVVITCRTQFFPRDEEIPTETGIAVIGPRKPGEAGTFKFRKLYLSPFDDADVDSYLKKRYPLLAFRKRSMAKAILRKIPLLSVRPMLLAYIPEVVASGKKISHSYELYEIMIDAWLRRESRWADPTTLRDISERLAVNIYVSRGKRGTERIPVAELMTLADTWNLALNQWQITGRSLLNRDAEGNYKFAHRSIMEYLYIQRLLNADSKCYGVPLTDQMKQFLFERLPGILSSDRVMNMWVMSVNLVPVPATKILGLAGAHYHNLIVFYAFMVRWTLSAVKDISFIVLPTQLTSRNLEGQTHESTIPVFSRNAHLDFVEGFIKDIVALAKMPYFLAASKLFQLEQGSTASFSIKSEEEMRRANPTAHLVIRGSAQNMSLLLSILRDQSYSLQVGIASKRNTLPRQVRRFVEVYGLNAIVELLISLNSDDPYILLPDLDNFNTIYLAFSSDAFSASH